MRVLVCGGRDYTNATNVNSWLDSLSVHQEVTTVIHGGATGADELADQWAKTHGVAVNKFQADWSKHGKAAGPIRNAQMLDEGKPDVVLAFPGGRGTADMVRKARTAGIETIEVDPKSSANPPAPDSRT
ncbi:MAG: DUF2493 domain-containing protein [Solirubrobacterales bacterium]|nr:DUF2493 domain-containing protein [Solirubrobacterales bacterium]